MLLSRPAEASAGGVVVLLLLVFCVLLIMVLLFVWPLPRRCVCDPLGSGWCWRAPRRPPRRRIRRRASAPLPPPGSSSPSLASWGVRDILRTLDSFGYERTSSQRRFHRAYLGACLPSIYGPVDFARHQSRILAEHGMDRMQYEVTCAYLCVPSPSAPPPSKTLDAFFF